MTRKSLIARNDKRISLYNKYSEKRAQLKKEIKSKDITLSERYPLIQKLNKMPRDSSKTRIRNRCFITGRPKGVYSKFELCRHKIRELASEGLLPGVTKSSW
jgi:small subunit ribosomal protein S14